MVLGQNNTQLTGRFSPVPLFANEAEGSGSISVSPRGGPCGALCWSYPYGAQVTVTADAGPGHGFSGWSGPCRVFNVVIGNGCVLTMYEDANVTPSFECLGDACGGGCTDECVGTAASPLERDVSTRITVVGTGSVLVNRTRCQTVCRATVPRGAPLELQAATGGFVGWGGRCRGNRAHCQFDAFRDPYGNPPTVTARFR
jgi:hypothetical protein